jgi:hypothetical protein
LQEFITEIGPASVKLLLRVLQENFPGENKFVDNAVVILEAADEGSSTALNFIKHFLEQVVISTESVSSDARTCFPTFTHYS